MLAPILGTLHNLWYYERLMADMRAAIGQGTFAAFREAFHAARAWFRAAKGRWFESSHSGRMSPEGRPRTTGFRPHPPAREAKTGAWHNSLLFSALDRR